MSPLSSLSPADLNFRSAHAVPSTHPSPNSKTTIEKTPSERLLLARQDKQRQETDDMDEPASDGYGFDPDNTCFSTFSAVPNMDVTTITRLGQITGAAPLSGKTANTPLSSSRPATPSTAIAKRSAHSPTKSPHRSPVRAYGRATPQLLEFTEDMDVALYASPRQTSPIRSRGQDLLAGAGHRMRSPGDRTLNLLDFDLPPAPTPRSVPTITARELETLKAGFFSEISSLKAKLSGSQAELNSLKDAKDAAEHRVGTLSEELRDVTGAKTALEQEKIDWQKHDAEQRDALAKLKEEFARHEEEISRHRADIQEQNARFQEMENRAYDAEGRLRETEGILAGYQEESKTGDGTTPATPISNRPIEVAVEKVAKELHLLYKSKHEHKVAALKQTYEKRWKKHVDELSFKVEELQTENANLRAGNDVPIGSSASTPRLSQGQDKVNGEATTQIQALTEEANTLRKDVDEAHKRMETMSKGVTLLERDNVSLRTELQESRKENSDLVAVVDEMLAIDLATPTPTTISRPSSQESTSAPEMAPPSSRPVSGISKPSGLRGTGYATYSESRIGTGLKRSISGSGPRSGIMSNIERMGRGIGGRGGQE